MTNLLSSISKPRHAFLVFASQLLSIELNIALSFWNCETASPFWKDFYGIASRISHGRANAGNEELHCLLQKRDCIGETALSNCKSEIASPNCECETALLPEFCSCALMRTVPEIFPRGPNACVHTSCMHAPCAPTYWIMREIAAS